MPTRRNIFTAIRTECTIRPADLLQRVANGDRDRDGLTPDAYHMVKGEKIEVCAALTTVRQEDIGTVTRNMAVGVALLSI